MNLPIIAALMVVCVALAIALIRVFARMRAMEEHLNQAIDDQRENASLLSQRSEMDLIKDEFISTVSHELRTPLTSIRGALGLLSAGLMGTVDGKAQNLLRIALTNTDRLIRLINDILDLERMQAGRAPLQLRRCSICDLAQQSVETMTPLADARHVRIELVLAASAEALFFDGDSDRIVQVLTNLLSNGIKFSPEGGVLEVRIEAETDSVLLRVSDQGRGVPIDKLDAIFGRFEQVEAGDERQKGGTGLGLAICRTIIQQHNGSIWAESNAQQQRGSGTSIVVTLPRVARLQDARSATPLTLLPAASPATIIVCDDDAGIRTVVGESLRHHGYTIIEAQNGEEAVAFSARPEVAAVLLDLYMPGMTGWETLHRLKSHPSTASIPVIVLSVLSPNEHNVNTSGVAARVQGWVQKPFNEHLLHAEIARVLQNGGGPTRVLPLEEHSGLAPAVVSGFQSDEHRGAA